MFTWFRDFSLWLTHRMWNAEISRILCRAYSERVISSHQLHELAAAFDPTQKHRVYGANREKPIKHKSQVIEECLRDLADDKESFEGGSTF